MRHYGKKEKRSTKEINPTRQLPFLQRTFGIGKFSFPWKVTATSSAVIVLPNRTFDADINTFFGF
jgi:hypothetical protein